MSSDPDHQRGWPFSNQDDDGSNPHPHSSLNGDVHHHNHPFGQSHLAHKQQPHQSVGFWHPSMRKVRRHVTLLWLRTVLLLIVAILSLLSLYWGVLFRVDPNLASIVVHVVDFDAQVTPYTATTPFVGPQVVQVVQKLLAGPDSTLGWTVLPAAQFGGDPIAVRQAVYEMKSWAAVVVNPNATALLQAAVATGNASYDPTGAVQIVVQSARDSTTLSSYVMPQVQTFMKDFGAAFGKAWAQQVVANGSLTSQNLQSAAAAVNPGVAPTVLDIRPFGPAAATPSVSIGLIYLIIVSFFSFSFLLPIHMNYIKPIGHPPLRFLQFIVWRYLLTLATYFLISLAYSLISLAFQIPFWPPPAPQTEPPPPYGATAYGRGSFPVYWMLNFVGMTALGLACENVAMVVGQPWTALWLIFWVITNVSTSFYALDLAPGFYRWGYAWPLHNVVDGSRQILFDLHSRIGLNFGVLFVWAAVGTVLFPFCCYFMRWKGEHDERVAEKNKDRFVVKMEDGEEQELPKSEGEIPPIRKRGFMRGA